MLDHLDELSQQRDLMDGLMSDQEKVGESRNMMQRLLHEHQHRDKVLRASRCLCF